MGRRRAGWLVIGLGLMAAVVGATYLVGSMSSKPPRPQQSARARAPAAFARTVAERLAERHPGLRANIERENAQYVLVVSSTTSQSRVPLDPLYRTAAESPRERDELIDDVLQCAAERLRQPRAETLDQVRDHLMPMIKRRAFVIDYNQGDDREVKVPWIPLPNGLVTCIVIDYPDHVRYVTVGDLHRWERTLMQVKTRAIQNLQARTEGSPLTVSKSPHGEVYFHDQGDGYDAARILVLQRQRAAPNSIWPQDLIVAIPDRDLLTAAPVSAPEAMRALMPRIKQDASSREHPLTDRLFVVRPSGIEAYNLPSRDRLERKPAAAGSAGE